MGVVEHSRGHDLEEHIREALELIWQYEEILRLSDDPKEKVCARRNIQEQWKLVDGYLDEYLPLCKRLGLPIPRDIAEVVAARRKGEHLGTREDIETGLTSTSEGLPSHLPVRGPSGLAVRWRSLSKEERAAVIAFLGALLSAVLGLLGALLAPVVGEMVKRESPLPTVTIITPLTPMPSPMIFTSTTTPRSTLPTQIVPSASTPTREATPSSIPVPTQSPLPAVSPAPPATAAVTPTSQPGPVRLSISSRNADEVRLLDALVETPGYVRTIAFSPDGKLLAAAKVENVEIWDTATRRKICTASGHKRGTEVRSLAFSPDGAVLASGSQDWEVRLWEPSTCRNLPVIFRGQEGGSGPLLFPLMGNTYLWEEKMGK